MLKSPNRSHSTIHDQESRVEHDLLISTINAYEKKISSLTSDRDQARQEAIQLKSILNNNSMSSPSSIMDLPNDWKLKNYSQQQQQQQLHHQQLDISRASSTRTRTNRKIYEFENLFQSDNNNNKQQEEDEGEEDHEDIEGEDFKQQQQVKSPPLLLESALEMSQKNLEQQIRLLIQTHADCEKELAELTQELSSLRNEKADLEDKLMASEAEKVKVRVQLAESEARTAFLEGIVRNKEGEVEELQTESSLLKKENQQQRTRIKSREEELAACRARIAELEDANEKQAVEMSNLEKQSLIFAKQLSKIQRQLEQQSQLEKEELLRELSSSSGRLNNSSRFSPNSSPLK